MALYDIQNRTRAFGEVRRWKGQDGKWYSDTHKGDDYAETYGNDTVWAVQDAKVIDNRYSSTFGWLLWTRSLKNSNLVIKYHMLNEKSDRPIGSTVYADKTKVGRTGDSAANASGNHVHIQVELNGVPVNPRPYIVGADFNPLPNPGGGGATPIPDGEEDDMFSDEDRKKLNASYAALWNGGSVLIDGEVQKFNYGVLPVVVHNQTLIAQLKGQVAALSVAVSQITAAQGGTVTLDMQAIADAAEKGAKEALDGIVFRAESE